MKKSLLSAVALTALVAFSGSAWADILIGVAGPITGPNAAFGAQLQKGAEQAAADINAAGGINGQQIKLEVGDDVSDPKQGISVANKFVADGVDLVLDPLGTSMLDVDLAVAAPGARIVLFGNAGGSQPAPLPPVKQLMAGNVAIGGFSISGLSVSAPARVADALRRVLDLIATGRLSVDVTDIGPLTEVAGVHQLLADGRGSGKYVASLR